MDLQERRRRIAEVQAEERKQPEGLWYLSFASEAGFLGGCIVKAHGLTTAVQRTHRLNINPGGSVMSSELKPEMIPVDYLDRLLTKDQLTEIFGEMVKTPLTSVR